MTGQKLIALKEEETINQLQTDDYIEIQKNGQKTWIADLQSEKTIINPYLKLLALLVMKLIL